MGVFDREKTFDAIEDAVQWANEQPMDAETMYSIWKRRDNGLYVGLESRWSKPEYMLNCHYHGKLQAYREADGWHNELKFDDPMHAVLHTLAFGD